MATNMLRGRRSLTGWSISIHRRKKSRALCACRVGVELKESVRQEVGRLLNTRCPIPAHLLQARERTVIDYGVPDVSLFFPRNPADQERLAAILSQAIAAFEPRLQQVRVTVEAITENERALWVRVDAGLVVESVTEPVSFQVLIQSTEWGHGGS